VTTLTVRGGSIGRPLLIFGSLFGRLSALPARAEYSRANPRKRASALQSRNSYCTDRGWKDKPLFAVIRGTYLLLRPGLPVCLFNDWMVKSLLEFYPS